MEEFMSYELFASLDLLDVAIDLQEVENSPGEVDVGMLEMELPFYEFAVPLMNSHAMESNLGDHVLSGNFFNACPTPATFTAPNNASGSDLQEIENFISDPHLYAPDSNFALPITAGVPVMYPNSAALNAPTNNDVAPQNNDQYPWTNEAPRARSDSPSQEVVDITEEINDRALRRKLSNRAAAKRSRVKREEEFKSNRAELTTAINDCRLCLKYILTMMKAFAQTINDILQNLGHQTNVLRMAIQQSITSTINSVCPDFGRVEELQRRFELNGGKYEPNPPHRNSRTSSEEEGEEDENDGKGRNGRSKKRAEKGETSRASRQRQHLANKCNAKH